MGFWGFGVLIVFLLILIVIFVEKHFLEKPNWLCI